MIFGIVDALGQLRSRNIELCRSFGDRATGLPPSHALLRFKSDRHPRGSCRCARFASPTGHFTLDENVDEIAVLIRTFLVKLEQYSKAALITDWGHSALSERAQHVVTTRG
jgi:hypothetical protein